MIRRTLIIAAIVVLSAGSTSAQVFGPQPHVGTTDGGFQSIKVDIQRLEIGWPFEFRALDLCVIPVFLNVGFFVQVENCQERKIKLVQVECADIGKGGGDWPCYKDCEKVKIRANFEVKLGLKKDKVGDIIKEWTAYFNGSDTVDASGNWNEIEVCVDAWQAQLFKHAPGTEVKVGEVTVTVKPNV